MADFTPGTWSPSRHPLPAKRKFHFCIGEVLEGEVLGFLFLSSLARGADLVLANADIPCLPPNKTGETCVGLAVLIRIRLDALPRFDPQRLGRWMRPSFGGLNPLCGTAWH